MAIASIGFFFYEDAARRNGPPPTGPPPPTHPLGPSRPLLFGRPPHDELVTELFTEFFFTLFVFFPVFVCSCLFATKKEDAQQKKTNKKRISPFVCFAILARCHWLHGIAVTGFFYRVSPPPPPPPPPPPSCRNFPRAGESIKRV